MWFYLSRGNETFLEFVASVVFFFFNFYFEIEVGGRERERESASASRGGGRERERIPGRLRAVSTEPDAGLEPTNHEIMT